MRHTLSYLLLFCCVLGSLFEFAGCTKKQVPTEPAVPPTVMSSSEPVSSANIPPAAGIPTAAKKVEPVSHNQTAAPIEFQGIVETKSATPVTVKVWGKIQDIPVKTGQSVTKGQPLAQIENHELDQFYQKTQSELKRAKALLAKNTVSKATVKDIENQLQEIENHKNNLSLLAPVDGQVTNVLLKTGDALAPADMNHKVLLTLAGNGPRYVKISVPRAAGKPLLRTHQDVEVILPDTPDDPLPGKVAQARSDGDQMNFFVRILKDSSHLIVGQNVTVRTESR